MLELYQNIKKLRLERGWSQTELAKRIGYADKSMISRIENGAVDLPRSQIMKFAEVFGVSAGDLFGNDGVQNSATPIYYTDPEATKIAQKIFDDSDLRALFDASEGVRAEDLQMAADLLRRLKATNPDG
jgi:transcriptional regulator with XRE-family HTH domain